MNLAKVATEKSTRAPAVTRAIAVLKLLKRSNEPLGVNAIARAVNVVPSSCLHILSALTEGGLVQCDARTKQYTLGLGVLSLAQAMLGRNHFAHVVKPELEIIARKYSATALGLELDERERMAVVAIAQADTMVKFDVGVGSRFPAYVSAVGRCVAAQSGLSASNLKQRFMSLKWQSPPRFEDWMEEVAAALKSGVGMDPGNYIKGFTVVAAPLAAPAGIRQAISVVVVSDSLTPAILSGLKRDVKEAAQRIAL